MKANDCTATSSAQHIKKLWSLDKKFRSFKGKYIKFIKFKMAAMHSWLPWKRNIFFEKKSHILGGQIYMEFIQYKYIHVCPYIWL